MTAPTLTVDMTALIGIIIAGIIISIIVPVLVNLRIFVMSDTFAEFKLSIEREFVRKNALADLKATMDKRFDSIDGKIDKIFDKIDEVNHPK